jgi:hypothetical protein
MLDHAQANVAAVIGEDAVLGAAVADAGYWSGRETEERWLRWFEQCGLAR